MFIIRLWNYLKGYVIIKVEGLSLEKFINLCISKDIYLWDITRINYTTLEAKVSIVGFKHLKKLAKTVGSRLSIKDKKGLPFIIHKFKYRKMLFLGLIISTGLIFFLNSFIWTIDIRGNEEIKEEVIRKTLKSLSVSEGVKKTQINTEDIKNKVITDIDQFSYVSAQIKGTKLILDLKERDEESKIIEDEAPCDIVADKKAVIEKVTAQNGKSVVEVGDIVKKKQVLITGKFQDEEMDKPLLVHSEGEVIGITTHSEIIKTSIITDIKEETGKTHTSRELKVNGKSLEIMNGDIPFENYIEAKQVKRPLKNDFLDLPVEIIIHEYKEVNLKEAEQNIEALKKQNEVTAVQSLMDRLDKDAEVLSKRSNHNINNNTMTTEVVIEVREEIGVKAKISKENTDMKEQEE